jgi:hypothetical protein
MAERVRNNRVTGKEAGAMSIAAQGRARDVF